MDRPRSAAGGEYREPPVRWIVMLGSMKSLDNLVRALQERLRDRQAERPGGTEVDDQLELGGLLNGQATRRTLGTTSLSNSSCLPKMFASTLYVTPVTLPPGRARLATSPTATRLGKPHSDDRDRSRGVSGREGCGRSARLR